ncbi:hypothetical protein Cgig2_000161 [Carnegiea gigantea]|uniref:Uncharacterized protein n=1 Tax=Carnegiea gigantea TaxID=171969 RepID=A0A9Q1JRQ7_9CARY|nr:hypothetical protein Cgig2_000161 [Carnegiea gigantea]
MYATSSICPQISDSIFDSEGQIFPIAPFLLNLRNSSSSGLLKALYYSSASFRLVHTELIIVVVLNYSNMDTELSLAMGLDKGAEERHTKKEKYQSLKLAKQVPPSEEDNTLCLEAGGGWSEEGTVYRLGNSVSLFYEKPTNNAIANKPSYTPSIVAQL